MIINQTTTLIFEYPQDYLQEQEWCKTKEDRWIHKGTDTLGAVYENQISYSIGATADRKTEPQIEGVWNAGFKTGYDKGYKDAQKVKDSQDLVKDLVKAFCEDGTWLERQGVYTLTLAEAKQRAVDIIESVTQTETQNSNLTFEKRTMRDCYNCKKYETEGECIECRFEPKDEPQTERSE